MKNQGNPEEWLRRVKSNLELARIGRISEDMLYEDLCFQCQQAVEKSLKGLLIHIGIDFPFTHSISALVNLIKESDIDVPNFVNNSARLTVYASDTRYPPEQEPVDEEEYLKALSLAEQVYDWVREVLNK
jgi:HEPN domain-containing protein